MRRHCWTRAARLSAGAQAKFAPCLPLCVVRGNSNSGQTAPFFRFRLCFTSADSGSRACTRPRTEFSACASPHFPIPRTSPNCAPPAGSGSVGGTVLDVSGASVSGADVTLLPRDGTAPRSMVSEANGEFNFIEILPGSYFVMVSAKGFSVFTSEEFAVAAQQAYEVPDISLSLAATNMEVIVRPTEFDSRGTDQGRRETTAAWRAAKFLYKLCE